MKKIIVGYLLITFVCVSLLVYSPKIFVVTSGSMEPVIKTGSIVIVKTVNPSTLKTGDIIAFNSPRNSKDAILHRIINVNSSIIKTKGDNNDTPDPWDVTGAGVLGKFSFAVPYLGYLAAFIKSKLGFLLLIVLPSVIFIINQIIFIKKQLRLVTIIFLFIPIFFIPNIQAKFFGSSTINGASFSVGDLSPPSVPTLLTPSNNSFIKSNSINISWSNVDAHHYVYQSSNNIDFSDSYTSGNIVNNFFITTGTADYIYYWRVKSCNVYNICSSWSSPFKFTVDDTPPTSSLNNIPYTTNQNLLNLVYTASDNNTVDHTSLCYSFNFNTYQCVNNFDFNFDQGDGTYYFYTQATDIAGNIEDKSTFTNSLIFDTTPPTTNLLINPTIPSYTGQNLSTNIGPSFYLDSYIEKILIPHNLSSNLTFSFKYFSEDSVEFSHLDVGVSTVEANWSILSFGGIGDFDWQTISHSLLQWAGQTIDIYFKLTALDPTFITQTIIKDLNISTLDLRIGDTTPPQFLSTDLGSGVFESSTAPSNISSSDLAGNIESTHSISIVTLPHIVLNKITSSIITLYNNTDSSVDLASWTLDLGVTTISIDTTIPSFSSLDFNYDIGTTKINLLNNFSQVVDSTTFQDLGSGIWQRQQNGLGPWILINDVINLNLENRLSETKVTLVISGLGDTSINMDYSINYLYNGVEKQIAGTISPQSIDANHSVSRDFYLGTCSTGVCLPAFDVGTSFTVTFSNLPSKTFQFN